MDRFPIIMLTRYDIACAFDSETANSLSDVQVKELAKIMLHKYNAVVPETQFWDMLKSTQPYVDHMIKDNQSKFKLKCPHCENSSIYTVNSIVYVELDESGSLVNQSISGPTSDERVYKCDKCGFTSECINCFM